jgi:hypothetical protein
MTRPTTNGRTTGGARVLAVMAMMVVMVAATTRPGPACAGDMATAAADTMRLSVIPVPAQGLAGDVLQVDLVVPVEGPAFNAYDAYLSYDPTALQFLPPTDPSTQEGLLMTAACGARFHVFQADTLAGRLRVSHSLLCAGNSVTGPGVVYRFSFRCRNVEAMTRLELLLLAPYRTKFYMDGLVLLPLVTKDALVRVGPGTPSAAPLPAADITGLRATPNPFNPRTTITFEVAPSAVESADADVTVHSLDGRMVRRLWSGTLTPGTWAGEWDGRDDAGRDVAAGIYLVRARAGDSFTGGRVALVR